MQIIENKEKIEKIKSEIIQKSSDPKSCIYIKDLSGISSKSLEEFLKKSPSQNFAIGIAGCVKSNSPLLHDKQFGPYGFDGCWPGQSVLTIDSDLLIFTLKTMEEIENGIKSEWSNKERATYLYGFLSTEYLFDENVITDLTFLLQKKGSCTNFSKFLNQLLNRQGIESYVFATQPHAFNIAKFDEGFYPIDAASGSLYLKSSRLTYFGLKDYFKISEIVDLYDECSKEEQEKIDSLYFTQDEVLKLLDATWPKYSQIKREQIKSQEKDKTKA